MFISFFFVSQSRDLRAPYPVDTYACGYGMFCQSPVKAHSHFQFQICCSTSCIGNSGRSCSNVLSHISAVQFSSVQLAYEAKDVYCEMKT